MHTATWLVWLGAALAMAALTTNPLYLAVLLLATVLVFAVWREPSRLATTYPLFLAAGFALWLGYLLFSVVTIGGGRGQTVLFALPQAQLPALLGGITLGGPVTAEDLMWGIVRGTRLLALLAIFGAFNALADHYRLLRMTPRSLFHAGLAVTIAITFVPQFVRTIAEITEAQRVRGHRFRGPASYLPLVAPLLAGSLESSLQLAEALDARGYGRTVAAPRHLGQQMSVVGGLLLFGAGLFAWLYYGANILAFGCLAGGGVMLGVAFRSLGRLVTRSVYRRERWRRRDSITTVTCVVGAIAWIVLAATNTVGLAYNPYPAISAPPFSALAAFVLLALITPALLRPRQPEGRKIPVRHFK